MDMKLGIALGRFRKPSLGALPVVLNKPTNLQVTEVAGGRKLTWTNNSEYHSGTYVYRSTATMDPANLPAPIADAPPASGSTFEYIDNAEIGGDQYYRTQDHEGGQVSAVSAEVMISLPPSFSSAQVGDYIGGGVYAGTHTDGTDTWHLIFAVQAGESPEGPTWGNEGTVTGASDPDNGFANQTEILTNWDDGSAEAFYYCRDYVDADGNNDYYLPARNELDLAAPLESASHPEFSTDTNNYRWASTELDGVSAEIVRLHDGYVGSNVKGSTFRPIRPARRVLV